MENFVHNRYKAGIIEVAYSVRSMPLNCVGHADSSAIMFGKDRKFYLLLNAPVFKTRKQISIIKREEGYEVDITHLSKTYIEEDIPYDRVVEIQMDYTEEKLDAA